MSVFRGYLYALPIAIVLWAIIIAWLMWASPVACGLGYWVDVPGPDERVEMGELVRDGLDAEWRKR